MHSSFIFIQYRHEINPNNLVNATAASQQHSKQINTTAAPATASTINFLFRLPFMSSLPSSSPPSSSSQNKKWNVINHLSSQFGVAHAMHTTTMPVNITFDGLLYNDNKNIASAASAYSNNCFGKISGSSHRSGVSSINRQCGIYSYNSSHLNYCHKTIQRIIQFIERYQFVSYTVIGLMFYGILFYFLLF